MNLLLARTLLILLWNVVRSIVNPLSPWVALANLNWTPTSTANEHAY